MEKLQQQITELNIKVEQLSQLIEKLTSQVSLVIAEKASTDSSVNPLVVSSSSSLINHQDVLIDDSGENINSINQDPLQPEIQIQRLTAQLTAAYNRIASLEEQLMSRRTSTNR